VQNISSEFWDRFRPKQIKVRRTLQNTIWFIVFAQWDFAFIALLQCVRLDWLFALIGFLPWLAFCLDWLSCYPLNRLIAALLAGSSQLGSLLWWEREGVFICSGELSYYVTIFLYHMTISVKRKIIDKVRLSST